MSGSQEPGLDNIRIHGVGFEIVGTPNLSGKSKLSRAYDQRAGGAYRAVMILIYDGRWCHPGSL